jgi:Flp pilus assembly protein TadD
VTRDPATGAAPRRLTIVTAGRALAAGVLTLAVAAFGCGKAEDGPAPRSAPPVPAAPPTFVGGATCASCHEREAAAFRESHHARAMQPASEATVLGDFGGVRFTHRGVTSTFFRRDGKFFVTTEGSDGRPAEFEITYTFGVDPLQQYLVPFPGGRLQALGIAWDTRPRALGGARWYALYPGERLRPGDALHWTGREQTWNYQCAECHSTDLQRHYDLAGDRYATTWAEVSLSCEACHGPGSAHVAWARSRPPGAPVTPEAAGTGLPVGLGRSRGAWVTEDAARGIARWTGPPRGEAELDACARCHARRRPIAEPYPYGRPFLDTHVPALLFEGLYHADGQILGEVYEYGSFVQSRMHRAGVTCADCHDPHTLRLRAPGNQVCAVCHLPARFDTPAHHHHRAGSEGARCVACHMPTRTYLGVDVRRDHGFRTPRPDLSLAIGTPEPCTACHAGRPVRWAARTVAAWRGPGRPPRPHFALALDAGRRGRLDAERQLAALAVDAGQPAIARATALALLPSYLTAVSLPAVEAALRDGDALVRQSALGAVEGLPPDRRTALAAPALRDPVRAVRIAAARALAGERSLGPEQRTDLDRALAELVESELVLAERPEAHLNLALLYARLGRAADAESELRTALRLDPGFVPALVNLADLFRAQGRDGDGERFLEQALRVAPDSAEALHALGLLRVRQGRRGEALQLLGRAAARAPDSIRFGYVHAVGLHSAGDTAGAVTVLERLHRRRPADREVLTALVTISRDRGDLATALRHAETLATLSPDDRAIRDLRDDLRRRLAR